MPFIRKVHLVVSGESQVPEWLNRDEVNVVLHKDIIPEQLLPTFNCNPIEIHLHNIDGLDEEYLYFNDDIFPLKECKPTDFFRNGRGVIKMSHHLFNFDMFKQICHNSNRVARQALGLRPSRIFLRPQHICTPMLRSEVQEVYNIAEQEILDSMTPIRAGKNLNQYLFLDYMYLKGKIINERISKKHFSLGVVTVSQLRKFIERPTHKLTCINDVQLSEERYLELRKVLLEAFERALPKKSKFEC